MVGVIASLAVYFAVHTLFNETERVTSGPLDLDVPLLDSLQWSAVAITALGCLLIFRLRWGVLRTLGVCTVAGIAWGLLA